MPSIDVPLSVQQALRSFPPLLALSSPLVLADTRIPPVVSDTLVTVTPTYLCSIESRDPCRLLQPALSQQDSTLSFTRD